MPQFHHLLLLFLLITSCDGCDPLEELNNGNADPERLIIELSGTEIATAINQQLNTFCNPQENFIADVEIEIRTASIDNGGTIIPDPSPFGGPSNTIDDEFEFQKYTDFNQGVQWTVMVPDVGAYAILMEIELQDCSLCCHGGSDLHCSNERRYDENTKNWRCETGRPQLVVEAAFASATRPDFDQDWPARNYLTVRRCRACSCELNCE
ncbi:MAG: hypothetical protein AAFW73_04660 [Bacteroidota bacterium]